GNYRRAYREATAEHDRTSGVRRDQAALIAGLSAHALDQDDTALGWLRPLMNHPDRQIAGRASATAGLIEAERGNHETAAAALSNASRWLSGDAAAQAHLQAAHSYEALGRIDAARLHYRLAHSQAIDRRLRSLSDVGAQMSAYTVQVGAFRDYDNAERSAARVIDVAEAFGLGNVRIVEMPTVRGDVLYLVQIGEYDSEGDAQRARLQIGGDSVVTASR
ncbi:MAG: SPOR domain-containing protein, partial [Planctomycetota bacterium]